MENKREFRRDRFVSRLTTQFVWFDEKKYVIEKSSVTKEEKMFFNSKEVPRMSS